MRALTALVGLLLATAMPSMAEGLCKKVFQIELLSYSASSTPEKACLLLVKVMMKEPGQPVADNEMFWRIGSEQVNVRCQAQDDGKHVDIFITSILPSKKLEKVGCSPVDMVYKRIGGQN